MREIPSSPNLRTSQFPQRELLYVEDNDDNWMEGYFKEGVLHGFARYFDVKGRLTFVAMHKNGRPHGVCWKMVKGGGCIVGRADEEGELTGIRLEIK